MPDFETRDLTSIIISLFLICFSCHPQKSRNNKLQLLFLFSKMHTSVINLAPSLQPLSILASGFYTCSMTLRPKTDQQTRMLSMSMTNLLVKAGLEGSAFSGEQVSTRLPIEPGLYIDQTELLLSNLHPSAELTVFGPAAALSDMKARNNIISGSAVMKCIIVTFCCYNDPCHCIFL